MSPSSAARENSFNLRFSIQTSGSRVSMCQDSSHLRRDRPFFSSSSSNKASSSNRVSSHSRGLDLPSSSHQPPLSCDPNPSLLHCLIHLEFQTCKMSFKRRNDSGGEASASLVRIPLLLIFQHSSLQGRPNPKRAVAASSNMQFIRSL